jgi:hypothetical protein
MNNYYSHLLNTLKTWIDKQHIYFFTGDVTQYNEHDKTSRTEDQSSTRDKGRDFSLLQSVKTDFFFFAVHPASHPTVIKATLLRVKIQQSQHLNLHSLMVTKCKNIRKSYILSTQCIYVFCMDLRTNSDYFTVQH